MGFFNRDRWRRDGLTIWCKACRQDAHKRYRHSERGQQKSREQRTEYRHANLETVRAGNRDLFRRRYHGDPGFRQQHLARDKTPKGQARRLLREAVRWGKISKPEYCERCLYPAAKYHLHGHHTDYSKPLDVTWLCTFCHGAERRKLLAPPTPEAQG